MKTTILVLTPEEAKTLYAITNKVGGPLNGPRGYVESIRRKLDKQFSQFKTADVNLATDLDNNSIYFLSHR